MANRSAEPGAQAREQDADLSFEEALARLEGLVSRLEEGGLPLAEAVEHYERGMGLAAYCGGLLDTAELRIREIDAATLAGDGPAGVYGPDEPFDAGNNGATYDMDREITRLLFDEE